MNDLNVGEHSRDNLRLISGLFCFQSAQTLLVAAAWGSTCSQFACLTAYVLGDMWHTCCNICVSLSIDAPVKLTEVQHNQHVAGHTKTNIYLERFLGMPPSYNTLPELVGPMVTITLEYLSSMPRLLAVTKQALRGV